MNVIGPDHGNSHGEATYATPVTFRKRGVAAIDTLVGARLRQRREGGRVSRRDMAEALGISVQQLSKYEIGTNRVSVGFLYQAAQFLRIPVQDLLVTLEEGAAQTAPIQPDAAEEEAVLRFVMRNVRSVGARKKLVHFLADLLRHGPDSASGFDGFAPAPVAGD